MSKNYPSMTLTRRNTLSMHIYMPIHMCKFIVCALKLIVFHSLSAIRLHISGMFQDPLLLDRIGLVCFKILCHKIAHVWYASGLYHKIAYVWYASGFSAIRKHVPGVLQDPFSHGCIHFCHRPRVSLVSVAEYASTCPGKT